ncbi:MAG TPA: methyltransferase domain-containing protein [Pyrinomonadaceae bacterium]|nr:methyltransferase domain-containing protein [Pyrinomonadaceae bacterium]
MSQVQLSDTLREWRESAKYWETYARTIQKMFAPVTSALIEEAGIIEGDTVLDVAGGPGEPSLTIAEKVGPAGSVMCTDAVAEMVAAAESEAARRGVKNIQFQQCEADSLPFENNSFDAAVSRLGVMFFPDPVAALREMLRVTKTEGTLSFAVWHESNANPFAYIVTDVISRHMKTQPADPDAPNAFRFAEPGKLVRVLAEAGAVNVRERLLKFQIEARISREEFWEMRSGTSGTLREKLDALSSDLRLTIANEVKKAVAEFFPNEQMSFPAQMLIVSGDKSN